MERIKNMSQRRNWMKVRYTNRSSYESKPLPCIVVEPNLAVDGSKLNFRTLIACHKISSDASWSGNDINDANFGTIKGRFISASCQTVKLLTGNANESSKVERLLKLMNVEKEKLILQSWQIGWTKDGSNRYLLPKLQSRSFSSKIKKSQ